MVRVRPLPWWPWGTLRCTHGDAAGEKSGTTPVNRSVVNVGTIRELPTLSSGLADSGQVRCRLLARDGTEPP